MDEPRAKFIQKRNIISNVTTSQINTIKCRGELRDGSTIFQNSLYPNEEKTPGICILDVIPNSDVCGIRYVSLLKKLSKKLFEVMLNFFVY